MEKPRTKKEGHMPTLADILASLETKGASNTQPTSTPIQTAVNPTPIKRTRKRKIPTLSSSWSNSPEPAVVAPSEPKVEPQVEAPQQPKVVIPNRFAHYPFATEMNRNLRKFELWFGNPSTGKTTYARKLAQSLKDAGQIDDYIVINSHEDLTVMSLFKTTKTDDNGAWKFLFNRFFQMLTDDAKRRYIIIIDEINTQPMSVLKAQQPILDDTEGTFDFEEKTYTKNPNVFFIATMNHRDVGTSTMPDAIKSRAFPVFFKDLSNEELEKRSSVPAKFIDILKRIHDMFKDLGQVHPFYNDVRQLKNMLGLSTQDFRNYIIAQLEFANVDYATVISISPEFDNLVKEYTNLMGGK